MTLLVLNRRPLLGHLASWLPEQPLVVVTDAASLAEAGPVAFHRLEVVANYDSDEVEEIADALCAEYEVSRVLSIAEADVYRAARLRERHGLRGQSVDSALAFRDKYRMKRYASAGGVAVAPMRLVCSAKELVLFAEQNGVPLVVKPVSGAGSIGVRVFADSAGMAGFDPQEQTWLVERFVDGTVCHVDGLMAAGRVLLGVPSRYLHANLATVTDAAASISGMLATEDPLSARLLEATAAVLTALPTVAEVTAFHAEFFHTPADELLLCEIACRPGGCGIVEAVELATDVNLYQAQLRGQVGLPVLLGATGQRYGWAWFPPRRGVLTGAPSSRPPGTHRFDWFGQSGTSYSGPCSSTDRIAELIFRIHPNQPVVDQLHEINRWWDREVRWSAS